MKSFPFSSIINKMNGGNYEMWAMQVKRTLIAHDKEHLILEPEPVQKARNETRIMQLHHDIHQMRQDGRPLHTYYSSLKSIFERLNSYFPACKCEQQMAYRDMLMVGVFLSGLDSVYESAKNQMLTSPSIPPIDEAYSRLSRIPISAVTVPDTTSAMLATRGRGGPFFVRGRGGRGRGTTPSRPVCQFCHRIGHTVDKCWQKHGRPTFANQTVSTDSLDQPTPQHTASSSDLRVDDIITQLRNLIGDRAHQAPDPTTSTVTTVASASSSGMYSAFTVCPATDTTDWFIDSGASTHLCGDKAQFTSYVPTPPGRSVILADGKYSPVVGHVHLPLPLMSCPKPVGSRFGAIYQRRTKPVKPAHCALVPSPSTPKVIPEHTDFADNSLSDDDPDEYPEHAPGPGIQTRGYEDMTEGDNLLISIAVVERLSNNDQIRYNLNIDGIVDAVASQGELFTMKIVKDKNSLGSHPMNLGINLLKIMNSFFKKKFDHEEMRTSLLGDLLPSRLTKRAAGYDLESILNTVVPARGKALTNTGLTIAVPKGTYGQIASRSGLALNYSILVGAGVIDADYRGEVKILLFNHSGKANLLEQHGKRINAAILLNMKRIYP
ncbi:Deoxyuridine 5'-triphosphate nucleotidohydrolase [Nymphaea thermarum]|nr:Deoxyuridine 5'-triphosphate nucleotidohydrolase [Nymphaea thermarum]